MIATLCTCPRDQFEWSTIRGEDWIKTPPPRAQNREEDVYRWRLILRAYRAAAEHPMWEGSDGISYVPHVGYDVNGDAPFFIFKCSNNGNTFIVSEHPMTLVGDAEPYV